MEIRVIEIDSFDAWSKLSENFDRYFNGEGANKHTEDYPEEHQRYLDDYGDLHDGEAALATPDGAVWWAPISGDVFGPRITGDTALALLDYVLDHNRRAHHYGPHLPLMLWNRKTMDPQCVWCFDCRAFVDVSEDARFYDEHGRYDEEDLSYETR